MCVEVLTPTFNRNLLRNITSIGNVARSVRRLKIYPSLKVVKSET